MVQTVPAPSVAKAFATARHPKSAFSFSESRWRRLRQILLVVAIGHQIYYCYRFPSQFSDKSFQIAAANSFANGEPFLVPQTNLEDLSLSRREPLAIFPLGYPVLLAPLLWVIEGTFWPTFLIDSAAVVVYFGAWYTIIERCSSWLSEWSSTFVWLMWAFGLSPLIVGASSDIVAEALFSCGLAFMFGGMCREKPSIALILAAGLSAGLAATVRFAYWPLMAVVPVTVLFGTVGLAHFRRTSYAIAAGVVAAIPWGIEVATQTTLAGRGGFVNGVSDEPAPLHWAHLLRFFPFPAAPLGIDKVARKAELMFALPLGSAKILLWLISLFLLMGLTAAGRSIMRQSGLGGSLQSRDACRSYRSTSILQVFIAAVATLALTGAMLAGLSLTTSLINAPWTEDGLWTYVQEPRYFLPTSAFLTVLYAAVAWSWSARTTTAQAIRFGMGGILAGSLLACSAGRFAADVGIVNQQGEWSTSEGRTDDRTLSRIIAESRLESDLFYSDINQNRKLIALANGAFILGSPFSSPHDDPRNWQCSQPIRVIVALNRTRPAIQEPLRERIRVQGSKPLGTLHDGDLYLVTISADSSASFALGEIKK